MTNIIEIKVIHPLAEVPSKVTSGSAGYDLRACISNEVRVFPGETKFIPTGLSIHIKDPTIVGLIYPRSKKGAKNGIVLGNLTGVIDSDYQGELIVAVWNRNFDETVYIMPDEAIAQIVFTKLPSVEFKLVQEFENATKRGDGGITKNKDTK